MRVLLAGGGTGGHIFPGVALIEEFRRANNVEFLFVSSKRGIDSSVLKALSIPHRTIDMEGFRGRGFGRKIYSLLKLIKAIVPSIRIMMGFKPELVIGLGGYASFPLVLIAALTGKRTVLLEQNLLPGLTNRLLAPFVTRIFVSFEDSLRYLPKGKTIFTGNPVRRSIIDAEGVKGERFTILVFGGSQGARRINTLILESLDFLKDLKDFIEIIHQVGNSGRGAIEKVYMDKGFKAEVVDFIDDMGKAYIRSHLVICRGGANTISELMVRGKASIIIPFPYAASNHQEINASFLEGHGAARVIKEGEASGRVLAEQIRRFYSNPSLLKEMEDRARFLGMPEAASTIVSECFSLKKAFKPSLLQGLDGYR